MGIRQLTYRDIPANIRAQKAREVMQRVQSVLSDPLASEELKAAARARQDQLRQWSSGSLAESKTQSESPTGVESAPTSEGSTPEAHVVEVRESVRVDDGPS